MLHFLHKRSQDKNPKKPPVLLSAFLQEYLNCKEKPEMEGIDQGLILPLKWRLKKLLSDEEMKKFLIQYILTAEDSGPTAQYPVKELINAHDGMLFMLSIALGDVELYQAIYGAAYSIYNQTADVSVFGKYEWGDALRLACSSQSIPMLKTIIDPEMISQQQMVDGLKHNEYGALLQLCKEEYFDMLVVLAETQPDAIQDLYLRHNMLPDVLKQDPLMNKILGFAQSWDRLSKFSPTQSLEAINAEVSKLEFDIIDNKLPKDVLEQRIAGGLLALEKYGQLMEKAEAEEKKADASGPKL